MTNVILHFKVLITDQLCNSLINSQYTFVSGHNSEGGEHVEGSSTDPSYLL